MITDNYIITRQLHDYRQLHYYWQVYDYWQLHDCRQLHDYWQLHDYNNYMITSWKQITEIANTFYINKIRGLREKFNLHETNPIEILNFLIPPNKRNFYLQPITIERVNQILKKAKGTNSIGNDNITIKTFKNLEYKLPHTFVI